MDRDELLIERLITGELTDAERAVLDRRARQDPALQERIVAEQRLSEDLSMLATLGAPNDLLDSVMACIERDESRGLRGLLARAARWRFDLPVPAWGLAALVLVALGFGLGRTTGPASTATAPDAARHGATVADAATQLATPAAAPEAITAPVAPPAPSPDAAACSHPVLVRFVYASPEATSVAVAGDFNGWEPSPMTRVEGAGAWTATVNIPSGTHEYVFVVDGKQFVPDPLAGRYREDGFGNRNALIELAQVTDF